MPADMETVALFLTTMAIRKQTLTPILSFRVAIRFYHTVHHPEMASPTDSPRVTMVVNRIKKKFCHPKRKKRAIAPYLARMLLLKLRNGRLETLSILELRNAALFNIF